MVPNRLRRAPITSPSAATVFTTVLPQGPVSRVEVTSAERAVAGAGGVVTDLVAQVRVASQHLLDSAGVGDVVTAVAELVAEPGVPQRQLTAIP
jgi:hypothetical protein